MPRIVRMVSVVALLALGSHAGFSPALRAQEPVDTRRVLAETGNGIGAVDSLQRNLERISASLRGGAVAAGRASLATRKAAIKSGG
ncbi:MAG TPA: hypothetical protein VGG20_05420 [Thermoanaerobaculia bacterium]|jgi:hypothetical protein